MRGAIPLVFVAALLAAPAQAAAADSWSPPQRVATGTAPAVALGPAGEQLVAFTGPGGVGAAVTTRRGDAPWSSAQTLTAAAVDRVSIDVSPSGDALIRLGHDGARQRFAVRAAGAATFGPAELTPEGLADASVALLPSGAVVAAGRRGDGRVAVAERPRGQAFRAAVPVSAEGSTIPGPWRVAAGIRGEAVVAWVGPLIADPYCGPNETAPLYVSRGRDGVFGEPVRWCLSYENVRVDAMEVRDTTRGLALSRIVGDRFHRALLARDMGGSSEPTVDRVAPVPVEAPDGTVGFAFRMLDSSVTADFIYDGTRPNMGGPRDGSVPVRSERAAALAFDVRSRAVVAWSDGGGVRAAVYRGDFPPPYCPAEPVAAAPASALAMALGPEGGLLAWADESTGGVSAASYTARDGCVQPDLAPAARRSRMAEEPAPRLVIRVARRVRVDRRGRTRLQMRCSRACAGSVTVRRGKARWGTRRFRVAAAGRRQVVVRLSAAARRALRRRGRVAARAEVRLSDAPVKRLPLTLVRR